MKKTRKVLLLVVVLAMCCLIPEVALAKSKNPYKDVTRKTVDAKSYEGICHVKSEGGWRGIAKKGKLYPNKTVTRREFVVVLKNMKRYGADKVDAMLKVAAGRISYASDMQSANTGISSKFVCDRMIILSEVLGYPIKEWKGTNMMMRRKDLARYIKIFDDFIDAQKRLRR